MRCIDFLDTSGTVEAGFGFTHGLFCLTVAPCPSFEASASIIIHQLDAVVSSRTEARRSQTLVDVSLTASAHKPRWTDALVTAHPVDTSAAVDARSTQTVVIIDLTEKTFRSRRTRAAE